MVIFCVLLTLIIGLTSHNKQQISATIISGVSVSRFADSVHLPPSRTSHAPPAVHRARLAELKQLNYLLDIQLQGEVAERRRLQRSLQGPDSPRHGRHPPVSRLVSVTDAGVIVVGTGVGGCAG